MKVNPFHVSLKRILGLIGVLFATPMMCTSATFDELRQAREWLNAECNRQIAGCRIVADDGTALYCPDGSAHYTALWTRDLCYMVEGAPGLIPWPDVDACVSYLIRHVSEDGTVPDRVDNHGNPTYLVLGEEPPTDNPQFLVKLAAQAHDNSQSEPEVLRKRLPILKRAIELLPRDPETGLVRLDPAKPHSPYGFTDTIAKTGNLLFSSILLWEANLLMERLLKEVTDLDAAQEFRSDADRVREGIETLWDSEQGCYLAASEQCRQPDVWGNAYLIVTGCIQGDRAQAVAEWLHERLDKIAVRGQVRHIPEPAAWEKTLIDIPKGTYQNGAYWATATGWLSTAILRVSVEDADRIALDCINDMRKKGVFECVNAGGYTKVPEYVASVTLPMQYFRLRVGEPGSSR